MHHPRFRRFRILLPFVALGFVALFSAIVMWLWNAILPDVLNAKTLTFWQAGGILVLAKILFGGFWGRGCKRCGPPWRHGSGGDDRWHALTPEQREQMRDEMRRRFGDWPTPPWHRPCGEGDAPPAKPEESKS
jgi:hypothetical protein